MIYKNFEKNKDFGFKDQIQRASVSIMNNIAEGFDRNSDREKIYFLNVAKALLVKLNQCFISPKN